MFVWELIKRINECNRAKGHRTGKEIPDLDSILARLALIHTEVSEAADLMNKRGGRARGMDAFKVSTPKGNMEFRMDFAMELADVVIRTVDAADLAGVDLATALFDKLRINEGRPHKYGTREEVDSAERADHNQAMEESAGL